MQSNPYHKPSFPLRQKLFRAGWRLVESTVFRVSPSFMFRFRNRLLNAFGADVHPLALIYPTVTFWSPSNLTVKAGGCLGHRVQVYNIGRVTIGDGAIVSQDATLCAGTHDYTDEAFPLLARDIEIGDRAWICAESFVGPGVIVGEGVVAGARSVVMRDLPEWMVCAGNPCKPIKKRIMKSVSDSAVDRVPAGV